MFDNTLGSPFSKMTSSDFDYSILEEDISMYVDTSRSQTETENITRLFESGQSPTACGIVYQDSLEDLLSQLKVVKCPTCASQCTIHYKNIGTALQVEWVRYSILHKDIFVLTCHMREREHRTGKMSKK